MIKKRKSRTTKYLEVKMKSDLFLATAGCEAIMNISLMNYPKKLKELTFNQIKEIILKNIKPKLGTN